jgi:hypothetical protein
MTTNNTQPASDIGPATPAPQWCPPDAEPSWDKLTEQYGGGMVCTWTRNFPDERAADVWVAAEDRVVDGRVMRSAPRIAMFERESITAEEARQLAAALIEAADEVDGLK